MKGADVQAGLKLAVYGKQLTGRTRARAEAARTSMRRAAPRVACVASFWAFALAIGAAAVSASPIVSEVSPTSGSTGGGTRWGWRSRHFQTAALMLTRVMLKAKLLRPPKADEHTYGTDWLPTSRNCRLSVHGSGFSGDHYLAAEVVHVGPYPCTVVPHLSTAVLVGRAGKN